MSKLGRNRRPSLTLVPRSSDRDLDWSILMARAQDGDQDAYRRLLQDITPYLRALAARRLRDPDEAEDVVQDMLLTVHEVRQTYDPTRPFGPWLVAIANRRIIDWLRRLGRRRSREAVFATEHETFPTPRTNFHEEQSNRRALRQAVEGLSPGQRAAIRLLKLEEKSLKEAAAESGMSVAALKVAVHRALGNLRKMLSRRNDT